MGIYGSDIGSAAPSRAPKKGGAQFPSEHKDLKRLGRKQM